MLDQAQDERGEERHAQIADHFDGGRRKVHEIEACDAAVDCKELGEADDEHDRGVLDVDDEVVADLGLSLIHI